MLHVLSHKIDWRAEKTLFYIGNDLSYTNYAVGFRVIVDALSSALEPTLGPSVISLKNGDEGSEDKWKITFHPQDFDSRKKDSDVDSNSSVNEVNEAYYMRLSRHSEIAEPIVRRGLSDRHEYIFVK